MKRDTSKESGHEQSVRRPFLEQALPRGSAAGGPDETSRGAPAGGPQDAFQKWLLESRLGESADVDARSVALTLADARKKGSEMRSLSVASSPDCLVCPLCETRELYPSGQDSMRCRSCRGHLQGAMLETLRGISALPDTLGSHACECGHPEMRRLPDRTYHCPACGSEVSPADAPSTP